MKIIREIPWASLLLLLGGYTVFGHFLADVTSPRLALTIGAATAFAAALTFTHPLTGLGKLIQERFKSDTLTILSLILFAGLLSVLLNWFKWFMPIFMILSCEALARIDLKVARISESESCFWLTFSAWLGLGLGWIIGVWELS
ncbi:MAG: hypothetical protein LH631_12610 [Alkalinema sp. CAN_BIN05]|nr:hypothetical protein [Alkalinema sp. CAN_BIN05]